ncbi:putative ribonuclease H-like domain-containing protein [Tanacetum coccineum]
MILENINNNVAPNTRISNEKVNTVRVNGVNTAGQTAVSAVKGNGVTAVKASAGCVWRPKMTDLNNVSKDNSGSWVSKRGNPQQALKNKGIFDSGCSRHMTGNKDFLTDYQDIDGGFVAFGGSARGGKITGKGKIRTDKLDFEDVFFVKELKFNLFSVSQMCDKKNSVLFTETECLVLSPDFKLLDESQVLLRVPRQSNMYSFDLKNVVPSGDLTCLFAKATIDESKLWHRRLGHVNFKTMNKLVKGNLVRGLPSKIFDNDHTCVACQKGKQHKASCKAKLMSSISQPLQMLHMDLFGPTSVRSINHKTYCLVVTDDFSREMNEFCGFKGIKREFSVARTPQQNGVAERKNRTLIEAARIEMVKIHTDNNVVDLLTKAFDKNLKLNLISQDLVLNHFKLKHLYPFFKTEAHIEQILPHPSTYQRHRKTQNRRRTKKDTKLPQTSVPQDLGADEAVHTEGGDSVERAITTVASLDAAQDSDNIIRTQTTAMPNVDIPQGMDTGGSPRRQDTMGVLLLRLAMEINMLEEKKYPLIKELLEKMLNLQLEAKEESTMAFELTKFIKSMLEE